MADNMVDNLAAVVAASSATDSQPVAASSPSLLAVQSSQLANLPCELLNKVAGFLPTLAFNSMRLTCKEVENKLFTYWSNSYFKKKQFSEYSVSCLRIIHLPCLPGDFHLDV